MNAHLEEAIWEGILIRQKLLSDAKEHAEDGEYQDAARCDAEASGATAAVFAILNHLGEKPPEMVQALQTIED